MPGRTKNTDPTVEEELVQSPGRTILRNFLSKKLALLGIALFLFVILCCFVLSLFFPLDLNFTDSTQQNISPGLNLLKVPAGLRNNAKLISVGAYFSVGLDNENNVYVWGKPDARLAAIPENMGEIIEISAGLDHILALNSRGQVFTWGNNRMALQPIPMDVQMSDIKHVVAGNQISVAITNKGRIEVWGNTGFVDVNTRMLVGEAEKIVLNSSMSFALTTDGNVYALTSMDVPLSRIPAGLEGRVADIAATDRAAAAVLSDGTVLAWGSSDYGSLEIPAEIQGKTTAIFAGRGHFTALLNDGTVVSWGMDNYSQASAPKLSGISSMSVGSFQNYAIDEAGNVTAWGLRGYFMGSDQQGRDMFRRILEAGKVTLTVGAVSVIISGVIGIIVGGLSGYYGGKVDMVLMRVAEVFQSIPFLPLAITLSFIIGNRLPTGMRMVVIMLILGILNWPPLARLTRGQVLVARENEFVTAAKALGVMERKIVFRHIMPNVFSVMLVNLTLSLATCMLIESSLSFLGFGISEPNPSWGNMLSNLGSEVLRNYPWRIFYPSLALGIAVISINLVGDAFRDAIDPKSNDR